MPLLCAAFGAEAAFLAFVRLGERLFMACGRVHVSMRWLCLLVLLFVCGALSAARMSPRASIDLDTLLSM